jgi:hypothetical protein
MACRMPGEGLVTVSLRKSTRTWGGEIVTAFSVRGRSATSMETPAILAPQMGG